MDLIPPPMAAVSGSVAAPTSELMASSVGEPTIPVSVSAIPMPTSLSMPLGPPPDLMMRALSPPTSLLPELVQPPAISLAAAAGELAQTELPATSSAANGVASIAAASKVDPSSQGLKPSVTSAAAATAAVASSAALGHAALLKKVR
jgi:hypothetical protein